ncbi:MAG TPA: triose-phosphate isomerase [bacterium]|nr:triose-phosphate isomerase [bacterium]
MTRKPFIAGNWKMNGDVPTTMQLCAALHKREAGWKHADVAIFPPYVSLYPAADYLRGSRIMLGAQNMHEAASGAFTGEISAGMLLTVGCQLVILGHSERRQLFGETDAGVNRKVQAALTAGLGPIVCVGETLEERESGQTEQVVERQLAGGLKDLTEAQMEKVTIAYEPVWAIGTGKVATVAQAGEMHRFIRHWLAQRFGATVGERARIQYGGSVKADNAKGLLADPDIDGALVGGASLIADEFDAIIRAAV